MSMRVLLTTVAAAALCCLGSGTVSAHYPAAPPDSSTGPLGEWPEFVPIGFITAPHPDDPQYQTYLYGDWGSIVGEEFI